MKDNKPWYVRFTDFICGLASRKTIILLTIIAIAILLAIAYGIAKQQQIKPYEEACDVKFKTYVNNMLQEISEKIIDKEDGITLGKIPDVDSEYDIKRTENGIEILISLDKEKVISKYKLETNQEPFGSYDESDQKFRMKVQISNDFEDIETTSFVNVGSYEEYEKYYLTLELMLNTLFIFATFIGLLSAITLLILVISIFWKRKNTKRIS